MTNRLAVVIPAYRPSAGLVDLVQQLSSRLPTIVIVDDGSGPDFRDVFARAAAVPNVQLLRHAVNLGKGAALKTGIQHALGEFSLQNDRPRTMLNVKGLVAFPISGRLNRKT